MESVGCRNRREAFGLKMGAFTNCHTKSVFPKAANIAGCVLLQTCNVQSEHGRRAGWRRGIELEVERVARVDDRELLRCNSDRVLDLVGVERGMCGGGPSHEDIKYRV